MKKYVLITLLVLLLSVSTVIAAESLDGFPNSQEITLNLFTVENQDVTAPVFGGSTVLSVYSSGQINASSYNNTNADPYIGVEMEIIAESYNIKDYANYKNIEVSRGDCLHFAGVD